MTSYEILRYPTISFWDILDAVLWNIHEIAFVNLEQFGILKIKCVMWNTYFVYNYIYLYMFIYIYIYSYIKHFLSSNSRRHAVWRIINLKPKCKI